MSLSVALMVLYGCASEEPANTPPATPETSTTPSGTTPLSTTPTSTDAEPVQSAPAPAQGTEAVPETSAPDTTTGRAEDGVADAEGTLEEQDAVAEPRALRFSTGSAPEWPFSGLIQLWADVYDPNLAPWGGF
ncbi:hypothetical protein [Candidatus Poriferisodalis sp.]|uniref:hypothetical protein n=1 Tax=Candidatus Poriferisodalis sp. TaxID=3101277 RepID=UPI003B018199